LPQPMTPGEQRAVFIEAMQAIKDDRRAEIGKHIWREHLDDLGPAGYLFDLIGIVGRLRAILWPGVQHLSSLTEAQVDKVLDLLIDLGNYAGFTHDWIQENRDPPTAVPVPPEVGHLVEGHECNHDCVRGDSVMVLASD